MIEVRNVTCRFGVTGPTALDDISLDAQRGSITGIAGASGAGKSTLARVLSMIQRPTSGTVRVDGCDLYRLRGADLAVTRRRIQLVPQDCAGSFNPWMTNLEIVSEPLDIVRSGSRARAREWLERVKLPSDCVHRRAAELSGGEQRRLALARALILSPDVLILDETFANLDTPVQAEIASLVSDVQRDLRMTCVVIGHDLRVLRRLASRIVILQEGRVVEAGAAKQVFAAPQHPHTRGLIDSTVSLPC